jgi:1-acyl-sn-glycerol-3-phosphate acyltransferase
MDPKFRIVVYLMAPTLLPKWLLCWCGWIIMAVVCWVFGKFNTPGQPYDKVSYQIIKFGFKWVCRLNLLCMGVFNLKMKEHFVDYSPYLGPEWKKKQTTYGKKSGIVCSNHLNWIDPIVHTYRQMPSAVTKADIKKIPFVGPLGEQTGCIYFDRSDKTDKRDVVAITKER